MNKKWNIGTISLSSQVKTPNFYQSEYDKFLNYGENNDIPEKLTKFLTSVPMHSSIVKRKASLILGGGLIDEKGNPLNENPNPFENWDKLITKIKHYYY